MAPVYSLFSDPVSFLEFVMMLSAAVYLFRAALNPSPDVSLNSGEGKNAFAWSDLQNRAQLKSRLRALFQVGGCVRLPKRSLMHQRLN